MNKQYTIIDDIQNENILLQALSNFDDEDFNGNNGIDYCKEETLEAGFESDKDYILNKLENETVKDSQMIITKYFDYWLGSYFYEYDLIKIDNKKAVLYLIWEY